MAQLFIHEQLPASTQEAILEFNEKYLTLISAAPPSSWADRFVVDVGAPHVKFPLALMSTKFVETREKSSRFRTMLDKEIDLSVVEYDAGFEVKKLDLLTKVFAYRNWSNVPARLQLGEQRHIAKALATLLEGGTTTTTEWDDLAFFHAAHLTNPGVSDATFSNFQAAAKDAASIANIQAEMTLMRMVTDENGDKLQVEPTEIWLPTQKFQSTSDLLNQEHLATGESNPIRGKLKPVHIPELTDANDWYLVDPNLMASGLDPLVLARYRPSEDLGLRFWDESSDFFKDTGKIKTSLHIWNGGALIFPHAIRRITGA